MVIWHLERVTTKTGLCHLQGKLTWYLNFQNTPKRGGIAFGRAKCSATLDGCGMNFFLGRFFYATPIDALLEVNIIEG